MPLGSILAYSTHASGRTYDTPIRNQEKVSLCLVSKVTKHKFTTVPSYDDAVAHKRVRIEYISDYEGGSPESLNDDPNDEDYQMSDEEMWKFKACVHCYYKCFR